MVYFGDREHINTTFLMIDAIKSVNSVYVGALEKDLNCQKVKFHRQNRVIELGIALEGLRQLGLI